MQADSIWLALAIVLVIEGIFPFLSPSGWRRMFSQMVQLSDGQIRFFGMCSIFVGVTWVCLL